MLQAIRIRLFTDIMAPLVLGGDVKPGRAIGARAALSLVGLRAPSLDPNLAERVRVARVRRARALVPIDDLGPPGDAEWVLCAALHDILQSTHPSFDTPLRRSAAAQILGLAEYTIDQIRPPAELREALSRHAWFARVLDIARTDATVSWWSGSRVFRGALPPRRWLAWPKLRRVNVARTRRTLLELTPLAVGRDHLASVLAKLLARTPITELATCTRPLPRFAWSDTTLALVGTHAGQTLAMRALARLPAAQVDAALGRATRDALAQKPDVARAAVSLLAARAAAQALEPSGLDAERVGGLTESSLRTPRAR